MDIEGVNEHAMTISADPAAELAEVPLEASILVLPTFPKFYKSFDLFLDVFCRIMLYQPFE